MKIHSEYGSSLKQVGSALIVAAMMVSLAACAREQAAPPAASPESPSGTAKSAAPEQPEFMFVQISDDLEVDLEANTLRLVNVGQQTLYFSDRPVRIAGHLKMSDYLNEWTAQEGADSFEYDPPNATLSVYEDGQPDNTLVAIEVFNPQIDGADLIYGFKLLDGVMPAAGGATTIFIDRIGIGGGVGVGYHGVGVGARGPGVR